MKRAFLTACLALFTSYCMAQLVSDSAVVMDGGSLWITNTVQTDWTVPCVEIYAPANAAVTNTFAMYRIRPLFVQTAPQTIITTNSNFASTADLKDRVVTNVVYQPPTVTWVTSLWYTAAITMSANAVYDADQLPIGAAVKPGDIEYYTFTQTNRLYLIITRDKR